MIEKTITEEMETQDKIDISKMIIEALEKQIPYKPDLYRGFEGKCKCGVVFLDRLTKYCGNCGQKLDWEERK